MVTEQSLLRKFRAIFFSSHVFKPKELHAKAVFLL
jgi:hypothetical protein